jgi:hypothetical protein
MSLILIACGIVLPDRSCDPARRDQAIRSFGAPVQVQ